MGINAVWGPPQSGKTTMAIDLAFALSRGGQSVLLISPELYSELAARLNIRIEPEKSLVAAYKNKESLKQIVHTVDDLLYALAVPFDNDAFGEDVSEEVARAVIEQAGLQTADWPSPRCTHLVLPLPAFSGDLVREGMGVKINNHLNQLDLPERCAAAQAPSYHSRRRHPLPEPCPALR